MTKSAIERLLRSPDANTETDSSTASDESAESSTEQQSEQEQSTESEESGGEQTDAKETDTEGTGEEEQTDDQQNGQEGQEEEQHEDVVENPVTDKEGDDKLPFHKHKRFQEVISEKNDLKQRVDSAKPLVDQATALNSFMRDNNIPLQDLQTHLQFMQTVRKNPSEAFKIIKPIYEQLAMLSGELISPELQAEVAAGTLSQERAQQIARSEATQRFSQWQQQQGQYGQAQQVQQIVSESINLWTRTKQTAEPDLKVGTPLWEQVNLRLAAMPQFRSADEAMQGCEKAFTEAKAFLGRFAPRTNGTNKRPPLSRQTANGNNNLVLKTDKDVINAIRAGIKPNQVRY
jgi:hypothetical protein